MNRDEQLKYQFFMSRIKPLEDIRETEKSKISIVLYEATRTTCILRVCKGRDLSAVCEALLRVKNPNTALVYQYVYAEGNTYILEEMLSGKTLDEIIESEGVFSETETAEIISEVCSGLGELHNMKPPVIHNDINTSNIMVCDDSRVKLFDFDISRTYKSSQSQNTELFGTEEYASPEHYGYGQSEPRTDIYSLGVTMHRMLTGECLSADRTCLYKGRMRNIIEKCIEIDPEKRYTSVLHLKRDLEKIINRKKTIMKLTALICVLLVIVAAAFVLFGGNDNDAVTEPQTTVLTETASDVTESSIGTEGLQSAPYQEVTEEKRVVICEKLSGELISLVALNNDMVYMEKVGESYRIKSSSGAQKDLQFNFEAESCELLLDPYSQSLYVVTVSESEARVSALSEDFEMDSTPLYSAQRSYVSDIRGMFFSDGVLYCNAFERDLIDTEGWCDVGFANFSPDAVISDRIFDLNSNFYFLDELNLKGDRVKEYKIPGEIMFDRLCCADSDSLCLTATISEKSYIYTFDGESFEELVCLSDYHGFVDFKATHMAVSESRVWMYDADMNAIKEFAL